ncbi:general transcription factor IIE subunit 1 [Octopus sinensis]|uniref:General transcription factor IIE subunit 1 n=1 Tax=Octopus sinensis TaxID=2607531 RepID=A0A6P7U7Q7_9MOLL|nr:general transcription factor IIE subunit 1 [Octopus sinensis]
MEVELLHEVPESLKRLVRLIVRGFYSIEHAIILDLLVRHPCMKEDDIIDLLKFERKQLRSMLNTLKMDKIVKVRMRVETDAEGHTTRHNYYFINYKVFVNVVKYKLDHVYRKIEAAERQSTSRSSFKCTQCEKTYTDLEAGQLLDPYTGLLVCMICQVEVEEDESAIPKQDARTMLAKFNEQIQPIYDLLKECEDVRLAPEILEPEPVDMKSITQKSQSNNPKYDSKSVWSGEATKNISYGYEENTVTITVSEETNQRDNKPAKEQPVWMKESTIEKPTAVIGKPAEVMHKPSTSKAESMECSDDIMRTLLVHEKKSVASAAAMAIFPSSDHGSSSDSDEETVQPSTSVTGVEEMDSGEEEEEEEVPMVCIGDMRVPLHEVTDNMVTQMTAEEKENYIRLGQELYQHLYE